MLVIDLLKHIDPCTYVFIENKDQETIEKGYVDTENFTSAQFRYVYQIKAWKNNVIVITINNETEEERSRRLTRENYERQFGEN